MNSIINQPSLLISASSPLSNHIGMYYSANRDNRNYSDSNYGNNYNGKDDRITPLVDKLYSDETNERSHRISSGESGNLNGPDIKLNRQEFVDDARRWSIGKVSLFILIAFNLADVFIHMVDAKIASLEAHDHYDALSADVIRPAFRYQADHSRSKRTRPSMGLSSAAMSSVTATLRPILPFTSVTDHEREDLWTNGLFGSFFNYFSSSVPAEIDGESSIGGVLSTPRGGAAVAAKSRSNHKSNTKKKSLTEKHESVLSSSDCFVPLKEVADSTLEDVAMSFRYTLESTRREFNLGKFLSGLVPRAKKMMERVSTATTLARGKGIVSPITGSRQGYAGDIDAINFCAAMRIFGEWRVLRQVPPGYKGYAVGIGLGQKDIVGNIAKIEHAIHDYIDFRSTEIGNNNTNFQQVVTSPTLRDLVRYEVENNIQDRSKLPQLKEASAGMGLLWVKRQLVYQTAIFKNVLDVPSRFDSSRTAVQAAYDDVYGDLHGWAIQKIFSYSFKAAPEGIEIYKYMNPHRMEEVQQEAKAKILGMPVGKKRRNGGPLNLGILNNTPIGKFSRKIGNEWNKLACNVVNEWDKVTDNVGNEWDKVVGNIGKLFGQQRDAQKERILKDKNDCAALTTDSDPSITSDETAKELEIETYIKQEMRKDAYDHIKTYLEVVGPLLDDLSALIDEFNMNDPTKV